jgi:environmental stress-induced protein Ves
MSDSTHIDILRAAAHRRMPWKNGGGETFEIAVEPADTTLDTMEWRVSMAVVTQDGPFSEFPNVDRTLCILDGAGLHLNFSDDGASHELTSDSAPFFFAADRPLHARLLHGTITDLNVMTRRRRYRHALRRVAVDDDQQTVVTTADLVLLLCEHGHVDCSIDGASNFTLDARDCALIREAPDLFKVSAAAKTAAASIFVIEIFSI